MKILYCSNFCTEMVFKKFLERNLNKIGQAVLKYHSLLVKGLTKQDNVQLEALSKLPVTSGFKDIPFFIPALKDNYKNHKVNYIPFLNLPGLNNFLQIIYSFLFILLLQKKKDLVVITDVLFVSMNIGILTACRIRGIKTIGIITDLPEMLYNDQKYSYVHSCKKIINKCDAYLLLTDMMNDVVNLERKKPFLVMEGVVDSEQNDNSVENLSNTQKKICLYSGSLDKIHGIEYLVKGFIKADVYDAELHIYGMGDFVPELKELIKSNSSIKYFGVKSNSEIVQAQKKAYLLINPRPSNQEFTKYSFPSKNMEYMSSGTPLLTTKLPGMPLEYYKYVYFIEEENEDGIKVKLQELLNKSSSELFTKGKLAKTFVLKNKNEYIQAKKILNLVSKILAE